MSDYETTQRHRNIAVGIFVIVALCALVWLVFRFGDLPIGVSKLRSFQVFVQFPSAPGVQENTLVRFCGYQIGRVTKVMAPEIREDLITHRKYHQTLLVLSIDRKYVNIPYDVDIKLMTRGLGSSFIEIKEKLSDVDQPERRLLVDQDLLQGSTGLSSGLIPEETQKKLEDMVDGFITLLANANDIIGDPNNKQNLKLILANTSEASKQATVTLRRIEDLSVAWVDTSEKLSKTIVELQEILEKINNGEGSAGKFVNDSRLYESLLEDAELLETVLNELKSKGIKIKW